MVTHRVKSSSSPGRLHSCHDANPCGGAVFIYQPGRISISPDPGRLAYCLPQIVPGRVGLVLDQEESNSIDGVLYLHGSSGIASGFGPAALRFEPTASTSGGEVG